MNSESGSHKSESRRVLTLQDDTTRHDIRPVIRPFGSVCCTRNPTARTLDDETTKVKEHEDDSEGAGRQDTIESAESQRDSHTRLHSRGVGSAGSRTP